MGDCARDEAKKGPSANSVGRPQYKGVYRLRADGNHRYAARAVAEDRATLGSDPSAATGPYGTGEILRFRGVSPDSGLPGA